MEIAPIKKVIINGLWDNRNLNVEWNLYSDVNILAGDNGSGKSTILKAIVCTLSKTLDKNLDVIINSIVVQINEKLWFYSLKSENILAYLKLNSIDVENVDKEFYELSKSNPNLWLNFKTENEHSVFTPSITNVYFIKTFDTELIEKQAVQKLSNDDVKTFLDWQIHQLQEQYKDYQINIGRRAIEALTNGTNGISAINAKRDLFFDTIDQLFSQTGKRIDRAKNDIAFIAKDEKPLSVYLLSSGEKQMLMILLTALVQDNRPSVMIMDEPEISLHTDWQEALIDNIRKLNSNAQIIIATHSPSIIINGWKDKVFEIPEIMTQTEVAK